MDFKHWFKEKRESCELTQSNVAEELTRRGHPTSPARVSHWESGRNKPPLDNPLFREALASVLTIDVNEMMSDLGFVVIETNRSKEAQLAASIVDHLPQDARQLAIDYLQVLERRFSQTG
jgi:transcriptional regulator with XRE-family HTH domain